MGAFPGSDMRRQFVSMKLHILALVLVGLAFGGTRVSAQGQDHFAFGLSGGLAIPTGILDRQHSSGPSATGSLAIGNVGTPVGFRIDLMYNAFGDRQTDTPADQGKARILGLSGNVVFGIFGRSTRLYAIGGAGAYGYRPSGARAEDATDLGLNAGLGIWIPAVSGFVETRFYNVFRVFPDAVDPTRRTRSARFYPVTFGVLF